MKKTYLSLFTLAMGAAMFTACTDDDINGGNKNPNKPLAELSKPKQTLGWHKRNTASPISIRRRLMLSQQK